jgi:signal peptidase I
LTSPSTDGGRASALVKVGREVVVLLLCAAALAYLLKTLVAQVFYIPSESMTPQLRVDDRVVVSKLSYRLHQPRRGDVVVFDCPEASCPDNGDNGGNLAVRVVRGVAEGIGLIQPSTKEFIKRVVALPGETIEVQGGQVYVDGRRLDEPYLSQSTVTANLRPTRVPEGHLFVLGDNRANSSDSRVFGPITRSSVVGRAVFRVWPPSRTSFL